MRYLFGFIFVLALGVMGCGETTGDPGGSGGDGGSAGMGGGGDGGTGGGGAGGGGGTGGTDLCEGVTCEDDSNECTDDGACDPDDGVCDYAPVEDGTACDESNVCTAAAMCADGNCDSTPVPDGTACGDGAGSCQEGSCQMACTEQGIRDAIAAGGGPYTFDCDGPQTVVTEAEIVIDNDVKLDGEDRLIVDGDGSHRVFAVVPNVNVGLERFAVTRGAVAGSDGGAISNAGMLALVGSSVTGSTSAQVCDPDTGQCLGGKGGGISNTPVGALVLRDTLVSRNGAEVEGGGLYNAGEGLLSNSTVSDNATEQLGGGIYNAGSLSITETTVSVNDAHIGGGLANAVDGILALERGRISENTAAYAGGIVNRGVLTLIDSEISKNTSRMDGGGLANWGMVTMLLRCTLSENASAFGGGISQAGDDETTVIVADSTLYGNTAERDGGGVYLAIGTIALTNSTISSNAASERGGGVVNEHGVLKLTYSTLSGNNAAEEGDELYAYTEGRTEFAGTLIDGNCSRYDARGVWISNGHNLETPGDTCGFDQPTDQVNVSADDLKLEPLQDNGGPTMTHALLPGSVAIDKIPADMCEVDEDQRGEPRHSLCDVGAFEVQP